MTITSDAAGKERKDEAEVMCLGRHMSRARGGEHKHPGSASKAHVHD